MVKRSFPILLITFIALSCFKGGVKQKAIAILDPGEMTSARATNVPINLVESMASKYNIELPNVLIKQQDGYEEFDIDRIEPPVSFDWMLFKYNYPIPEMRDVHEERIKIKYRFSRDGIDWSDWRYDSGTQFHDHDTTETFVQRKIPLVAPIATSLPNQYVEFKIISYSGNTGDTLLTNPNFSATRNNRNTNGENYRLKKNNKITFWSNECLELPEFIKYCYNDQLDPQEIGVSYAGAFGFGQFIPSSFNNYSVDFNEDGVRQPYDWPDVLGSIANYLRRNGYTPNCKNYKKDGDIWKSVYAYNHSNNYVMAVLELTEEIRKRVR